MILASASAGITNPVPCVVPDHHPRHGPFADAPPAHRWVATGQQKNTGDKEVPYVCVWDVDHCMQLQRLDHDRNERGVIALCFSGDIVEGRGGELLLTVGAGGG